MTPIQGREEFDRLMADWMNAEARVAPPSGLVDAALVRTRTARRRPRWLLSDWWIPTRYAMRFPVATQPVPLLLIAALVLLAAFLAILAGGQRRVPPPFGPAANGRLVVDTNGSLTVADLNSGTTSPLVQGVKRAAAATFSRDGTRLVFWGDGSPDSLFVVNADGSGLRKLAGNLWISTDKSPSWSPDGRFVALSTESAADRGDEHLLVIDVETGAASSVRPPALDRMRTLFPAWSPDGAWIGFVGIPSEGGSPSYWIVRPDGSDVRRLTTSPLDPPSIIAPHWAPDPGHLRVAYSALEGSGLTAIDLLDLETGREIQVTNSEGGLWPAWSPDAGSLVWVSSFATGDLRIWTADGSAAPRLLPATRISHPPAWSPDGREVYGLDSAATGLVVVPADGSASPVRIPHDASQGLPDWQRVLP